MRIVKVVGILSGLSTLIFVVYLWSFWGLFEGRWYGGFFVTPPQIALTLVLAISGITTIRFWLLSPRVAQATRFREPSGKSDVK